MWRKEFVRRRGWPKSSPFKRRVKKLTWHLFWGWWNTSIIFLGTFNLQTGLGPAERGSDEMDPSICLSRNEQMKAKEAQYFLFFFFWDSLDLLGRSCRNVFLQLEPPAHSNIAQTYSLLRRSYKAAIVVVNSMSPWSIIRTGSEQDNLQRLDISDAYMLKNTDDLRVSELLMVQSHFQMQMVKRKQALTAGELEINAGFAAVEWVKRCRRSSLIWTLNMLI